MHETDNAYEWVKGRSPGDCELRSLPKSWRRFLRKRILKGRRREVRSSDHSDAVFRQGHRNTELFKLASRLRGQGLSVAEIAAAMQVTNKKRCKPPLDMSEVAKIAESVGRYAKPQEGEARDDAMRLANRVLDQEFAGGDHLVYTRTKQFFFSRIQHASA